MGEPDANPISRPLANAATDRRHTSHCYLFASSGLWNGSEAGAAAVSRSPRGQGFSLLGWEVRLSSLGMRA